MKKLVIVGGGFAGLWAALVAAREAAVAGGALEITLVTREPFLTVRPRLYEVFTEAFRAPLAPTLDPLGVRVMLGEVESIDTAAQSLRVKTAAATQTLGYDRLVVATGSVQQALTVPGAAEHGYDIDTFAGAQTFDLALKARLAALAPAQALHVVVVGGGFTGIELATEMRRRIAAHAGAAVAAAAQVSLLERSGTLGPALGAGPAPAVAAAMSATGVTVETGVTVAEIGAESVTLTNGRRLPADLVVITTGLRAQALAASLPGDCDEAGRAVVDAQLRLPAAPTVFVAGDVARAQVDADHLALMSCQHAVPMGKCAGYNAAHDLLGLPMRDYAQPDYVTCLDLGDYGAVFTMGWERAVQQSGAEVKALKQMVNTQWIYPPVGDRAALLAAADIDAPWPPPT